MDVERGRTVKGWGPRRLGEHFLRMQGSQGSRAQRLRSHLFLLHPLLPSVFSASSHFPTAAHILPPSLQLALFHYHITGACLLILVYQVGAGALACKGQSGTKSQLVAFPSSLILFTLETGNNLSSLSSASDAQRGKWHVVGLVNVTYLLALCSYSYVRFVH